MACIPPYTYRRARKTIMPVSTEKEQHISKHVRDKAGQLRKSCQSEWSSREASMHLFWNTLSRDTRISGACIFNCEWSGGMSCSID